MPDQRARKASVRDASGEVVPFPYLPRVTGADKPPGWNRWSPAEKVEHLLGMSLDQAHNILSWPAEGLDPHRLNVLTQVWRVVFMIGIKSLLDGKLGREAARERNRSAVLEELGRKLRARPEA